MAFPFFTFANLIVLYLRGLNFIEFLMVRLVGIEPTPLAPENARLHIETNEQCFILPCSA